MKIYLITITAGLFLISIQSRVFGQAPQLPPTNLGLSNLQDGNPPGPGAYFQEFIQDYSPKSNRNASGNIIGGPRVSSLLTLSQLIYITNIKVADGNFGYTVLVPVVKLSAYDPAGPALSVNPGVLGDLITGPFIQWSSKHLFTMKFDHRFELDIVAPIGSFSKGYAVNPGSHLYTLAPQYTFTLFPTDEFSISMRHYLNYNFDMIGTQVKPGMYYNFNYSLEYAVAPGLKVELAGYYLTQLNQDSNFGNDQYYQQTYHITYTREKVFAYGPGLGYVTPSGLSIEIKDMFESDARNRSQGNRATLVLTYKLNK